MSAMLRKQFLMTKELSDKLAAHSKKVDQSEGELVRQALIAFFKKVKP